MFKLKYMARSRSSRFPSRVHSIKFKVNIKIKIKIVDRGYFRDRTFQVGGNCIKIKLEHRAKYTYPEVLFIYFKVVLINRTKSSQEVADRGS